MSECSVCNIKTLIQQPQSEKDTHKNIWGEFTHINSIFIKALDLTVNTFTSGTGHLLPTDLRFRKVCNILHLCLCFFAIVTSC